MNTNHETLKAANWDEVERETVQKIRALKAAVHAIDPDQMGPMENQICNGLILPALRHLAAFNLSVTVEEEETIETPKERDAARMDRDWHKLRNQRDEARKQRDDLADAIRIFVTNFERFNWGWDNDYAKELVNSLFESLWCLKGGGK